jgi:hypothetical protein
VSEKEQCRLTVQRRQPSNRLSLLQRLTLVCLTAIRGVHHKSGCGVGTAVLRERSVVPSISARRCRSGVATMMAVLALPMTSIRAFAQTPYYTFTTTIVTLGSQGQGAGGQFYVQPATNPQGCLNGVIYIQIGAVGSAQYATALAAFYSGRSVRLDYIQDSTFLCTAQVVGGY